MKQTAVEWYNLKVIELMTQREQENIDVLEFRNQLDLLLTQAKEMEREQIINAVNTVSENNVKYANMIVASWSQIEGELFMHNTKLAEQYYNRTFKNSEQ